jgi:hypothetical protein
MENTSEVVVGLVDSISNIGEDMMVTDPSPGDGVSENVVNSAQTTVPLSNEDTRKKTYEKKERRKTSAVWNDFDNVEVNGVKKSQCKWCKKLFAVSSSSSTSTLSRHLIACIPFIASNKKQKTLTIDPNVVGDVSTVSNFSFKPDKVRELAAQMVLYHEYPFNMMEHELFNKFMRACTPHWKKISRATVKNDCFKIYNTEKKKLKTLLSTIDKVNITTDMWTSVQKCHIWW